MVKTIKIKNSVFGLAWALTVCVGAMNSAAAQSLQMIDLSGPPDASRTSRLVSSSDQVSSEPTPEGLQVEISPGSESYPGLSIKPDAAAWDLSKFGHVEAKVTNTGLRALRLSMRVDNPNDRGASPWNVESLRLYAGQTASVKVIFGFQYGMKPGFPLDSSKVTRVLLFAGKEEHKQHFRIESLVAGGPKGEQPVVAPEDIRVVPPEGYVLGGGVSLDPSRQFDGTIGAAGLDGATVSLADSQGLQVSLPSDQSRHTFSLRPSAGLWDLRKHCEVRVQVKNIGDTPVTPSVQLTSGKNKTTDRVTASSAIGPGDSVEMVVPFQPKIPWQGPDGIVEPGYAKGKKGTGTNFLHDQVEAVQFEVAHEGEAALLIQSIQGTATPAVLPDYMGKRPPVKGDWQVTFDDNFDGDQIDVSKWRVSGPNWWGSKELTHWSKENTFVKDGMARLRFEKKHGFHNDDPESGHQSDYTGGYLDTEGKWTQRYGYFEARIKYPTAPGLWPSFWLMPDRGPASKKRRSTFDGGMEFDIAEHLTRWGPHRYNIAMHWDGYGKQRKALGTTTAYIRPDADGFITPGLLWTPGEIVYYCNGRELVRWKSEQIGSVRSLMMFTVPAGGWDNNALDDQQLPADLVIDYVRVWQRDDLVSEADGFSDP